MKNHGIIRTVWTIEVDEEPRIGDVYRDRHEHTWTVRAVRQGSRLVMGPPERPSTLWDVDLEGQHFAYHPEHILQPMTTRRGGKGWSGEMDHMKQFGFGLIGRSKEIRDHDGEFLGSQPDGPKYSWLYRVEGGEGTAMFRIGPYVDRAAAFKDTIVESPMQADTTIGVWARIDRAVQEFVRSQP